MTAFAVGELSGVPASQGRELVGLPVSNTLDELHWWESVGVAPIDPALSETAATACEYNMVPEALANCVVVGGKREGNERLAACVVLATTRADVNGVVKRYLDVRKASFLPTQRAVELTGMEYGGITPIGLPKDWPVLIDSRVIKDDQVVIGSGIRASKIIVAGSLLGDLPGAVVLDGLGTPVPG